MTMKPFYCWLTVIGFLFSGCSRQKQPETETAVFRVFSPSTVIERMNVLELKFESSSIGSTESHGEITKRLRDFNITYDIDERGGAKFNEDEFISRMKIEIERMLHESGIRIGNGGGNGQIFFFDYSDKNHTGWLEIVAARVDDDKLKVWSVIREETKNEGW
jgi:hypothetical protein